jgi:peptidoglycan/xylan/chitin deacetylase (PgdA/CDA1 family)
MLLALRAATTIDMKQHLDSTRFSFLWFVGIVSSFMLYFSGLVHLYTWVRRQLVGRRRAFILMYHRVRDDSRDLNMSIASCAFCKQMEYLRRTFRVVPLQALMEEAQSVREWGADTVAITFDDGYRDNFTNAFPVLRSLDLPATIFLVSGYVNSDWEKLSLLQILEMKKHSIDFGSHTVSHPVLRQVDYAMAVQEIVGSKERLEWLLGDRIRYFAYPLGKREHFSEEVKSIVRQAGYDAAFCTENGNVEPGGDPFEVPRIGIRNVPLFVFKTRVSGIFESRYVMALRRTLRVT